MSNNGNKDNMEESTAENEKDTLDTAVDGSMTPQQALLKEYRQLPTSNKMPLILSSYLRTEKLPAQFSGIEEYVLGVRSNLVTEAGGTVNQAQMIVLDSICESLILSKYISTWVAKDPGNNIIDKRGNVRGALTKG